jgi:hypothetical protein
VGVEVFQVSPYCYVMQCKGNTRTSVTLQEVVQYNNFRGFLLLTCGLFMKLINCLIKKRVQVGYGLKKNELCMSNVADNVSCPTTVSDSPSYRMFENIVAWFGR